MSLTVLFYNTVHPEFSEAPELQTKFPHLQLSVRCIVPVAAVCVTKWCGFFCFSTNSAESMNLFLFWEGEICISDPPKLLNELRITTPQIRS